MSSGVRGGASTVSIPSGVKKMIENIKEITGRNHAEDEIYAMLKECHMDPNETTQKLLLLDTFHEVKRKRDRRKENLNKEPADPKWKPGNPSRANRVGRGNYSSQYTSHDAGGGRNSAAVKENATCHLGKGPMATFQDMKKNQTSSVASLIAAASNGPSGIALQSTNVTHDNQAFTGGGVNQSNTTASINKSEKPILLSSPIDSIKNPYTLGTKDIQQHQMLELTDNAASIPSAPVSGSYFPSSDPVPVPSQDSTLPSAVETQLAPGELINDYPTENKSASAKISSYEAGMTNSQQKMPNDLQGIGKNLHLESSASRPSSYNNCSQVIGPQKVGPGEEWKPKSTNSIGQGATAAPSSEVSTVPQTTPVVFTSKKATLEMQELRKKLEESHISDGQHVIIPNNLHVPEVEKLGFCFGSFDAIFMNQNGLPGTDKSPSPSESSESIDEPVEEPELSSQNVLEAAEDNETKYPDHPKSPPSGPEKFQSSEVEVSSPINPDYNESKMEVASRSHQHPVDHTSSNNGFGFMPPVLSGQLSSSESLESQARDARLPNIVPQSFDPASYYAQYYHSGLEIDGRVSPFHSAGAANKYNGLAAFIPTQTSQTPQEGGVPLVLSSVPTSLVTQAAGVMQSSITASQQPLPVFRQPTGVHLPHYPPNYIPYGPYFSPFYVPPPAVHQFLSNGSFSQQPQAGGLYPTAPGTTAKYSVSQYKQGSNAGSSTSIGVPGNYGPYSLSVANYSSSSVPTPVTSTSNEDIVSPHAKENNVYSSSQQNEGSGVWFTTPSRDISTLQATSFYNLPQGHLAFTPTQPGHGTFTGIFHHAQAVTGANVHPRLQQFQAITNPVDMVGPTASVYQQPQHAQLSWPSNC